MEFDVTVLGIVIGFMVLANRLVAALITPVFDKYGWDKFWLMFVSWAIAGVLVWLADANLFAAYFPSDLVGKILTAIVAGGGSNLLHDLTDNPDNLIAVFTPPEKDEPTGYNGPVTKDENGLHWASGENVECSG